MEEEKVDILLTDTFLKQQNGDGSAAGILRQQSSCFSENDNHSESTIINKQINGSSKSLASSSNGVKANKPEWVRLNVGGQYFVTTKTTLCKNANSFFFKLCQDDPSIGLTTDKVV